MLSLRVNWPYRLAAILIAIALRFYVAAQLNPHTSMTIPVQVTGVASNLVLSSPAGSVRVDLSGPSTDLDTLRPSDIVAEVDLSNAHSGKTPPLPVTVGLNHDLPPDVRSQIKIDGPTPPTVVLNLEPLVTQPRNVHIHFDRIAPAGSMYGPAIVSPNAVSIQARQDLIDKIDSVTVDVVTPDEAPGVAPSTIIGEFDVVARSADGHIVDGVIINPAQVHVTVPLIKAASTKVVLVNTAILGTPGNGNVVLSASVSPSQVTLTGTPAALAKVGSVMTRPIDVNGATGTQTRVGELVLPPGLARVGNEPVSVTVAIGAPPSAPAAPAATSH